MDTSHTSSGWIIVIDISSHLFYLNCQVILKQSTLPKSKHEKYKKGHLMILKSIKLMVPNIFQPFLPNLLNKSWCPYIPLSTDFPRLRFACVFQHHLVASVPPIMGSFGYLKKRLIQFETQLLNPGSCTSIDQHLPWGSLCILSSSFRFMGIHLPF